MSGLDWGAGRYERSAVQLLPAAEAVLDAAGIGDGLVLDVGCGTGNATLLAAERGATVVGVDPTPRLLDVARARLADAGLRAELVAGDAAAIPLPDGASAATVSVFAVIFAPDPEPAAAELCRVTDADGPIVLSAWLPRRTLAAIGRTVGAAVAEELGRPPGPPPFDWHEADALAELFAPYGRTPTVTTHELRFTGPSPEAYFADTWATHPMWHAASAVLPAERLDVLNGELLAILEEANEDPAAFATTSEYVVAALR